MRVAIKKLEISIPVVLAIMLLVTSCSNATDTTSTAGYGTVTESTQMQLAGGKVKVADVRLAVGVGRDRWPARPAFTHAIIGLMPIPDPARFIGEPDQRLPGLVAQRNHDHRHIPAAKSQRGGVISIH